jgi:hypothetical protein
MVCNNTIAKGELRVAVEREVDTGSFVTKGAGYLHPGCAMDHVEDDVETLFKKIKDHSPGLEAADLDALKGELEGA